MRMGKFPSVLDLNKLKQELNISDDVITKSHFSEEDLQKIYSDYCDRYEELESLKNDFVSNFIVSATGVRLHSYSGRVKDPYHLIEKVVRKRNTNYAKYKDMTTSDYFKYITDLIGCRILLVYKDDWLQIHDYVSKRFANEPDKYINNNHIASSYDTITKSMFMAERPVANIRLGDDEIYPSTQFKIERDRYYRSLHYIVRYKEYYVEIQVRTLFEEAWGEVDHDVLYPYYKDDTVLVNYSRVLSRAAGMCDEMSAFFKGKLAPGRPKGAYSPMDVPNITSQSSAVTQSNLTKSFKDQESTPPKNSTSKAILESIVWKNTP